MTLYTEGSLLINLLIASKRLKVFFSISYSDTYDRYSCWTGASLFQHEDLSAILILSYRVMEKYAKEAGIDLEEDITVQ